MALEDAQKIPADVLSPSEQFVGATEATDVYTGEIFDMLTEAVRAADASDGRDFLRRYLARPTELFARWQQKMWRLPLIVDPVKTAAELLEYLRAHVGFGAGSGLPDRIADRLDEPTLRKLIKIAVFYWTRRGRLDALTDSLRTLAGVRPAIDSWHWIRWLIDEDGAVFPSGSMGGDVWLTYASIFDAPDPMIAGATGEVQVVIRVPDTGDLDRTLVEQLCELARPCSERYHLAFVDFLDTFFDGRRSHWTTRTGTTPAFALGADATSTPPRWPGLQFPVGAAERITLPLSSTWTQIVWSGFLSGLVHVSTSGGAPPTYTNGDGSTVASAQNRVQLRYYLDPVADEWYAWEIQAPARIYLKKRVGGVTSTLASFVPPVLLYGATTVRSFRVDVQHEGAGPNVHRLYIDGDLVAEHSGDTDLRAGTIEIYNGQAVRISAFRTEVFQRPLSTTVLQPVAAGGTEL